MPSDVHHVRNLSLLDTPLLAVQMLVRMPVRKLVCVPVTTLMTIIL